MKTHFTLLLTFCISSAALAQVGIGTNEPKAGLHVADGSVLFSAAEQPAENSGGITVTGPGRRLLWDPQKSAFRAGRVTVNQWDRQFIGENSFAVGLDTWATGVQSTAMGWRSLASGATSVALGYQARAEGAAAVAIGDGSHAVSAATTALGKGTIAAAYAETVIGHFNSVYALSTTNWVPEDRLFTVGNGSSYGSTANALVMLKNGNTGFGIDSPVQKLELKGNIRLRSEALSDSISSPASLVIRADDNANGGEPIIFSTGLAERARITSNGNVGVGTATPSEKLEVAGKVKATGITLATTGATAAVLDHYQEESVTGNLANGPNVFFRDYVINCIRIGKLVTVTFPTTRLTMNVGQHDILFGAIPVNMRPAEELIFPINTVTGGVPKIGVVVVKSNGVLYFKPDEKGSQWGGANSGFYASSVSFVIK